MLTVDFRRFPVRAGQRLLDLGSGNGRHSYEAFRRGARVVAADHDRDSLAALAAMCRAMRAAGEAAPGASIDTVCADARRLPFADGAFDRIIAAEVLEHVAEDEAAIAELARVLAPGGLLAVTVPRYFPERVCWALSRPYHEVPGGHVRIYRRRTLAHRLAGAGLVRYASHHAHALHSPYWWLKCAVGVERADHPLPAAYHRLLVWDIVARPRITRVVEGALNPVLGKSVVFYCRRLYCRRPAGV
ncbi:MAG: class I SAM-dependent methyltransferase [Mycobacteriales bacterium]